MADDLTPSESALLIVLMAEAREISNPELEHRYHVTLKKASREKLNNAGLIRSEIVGRVYVHQLDDKGWDRMHQPLDFDSPRARTLGAALSVLHDNLRERVLSRGTYRRFGEMFSRTAEAPENVEARVREVYHMLAPRPGAWVKHTDVRNKIGNVPEDALNEAFSRLSQAEDVDMMPESNQKTLSAQDRRYAVRVGGQKTHLMAIGTR